MKNIIKKTLIGLTAITALHACSLDEFNPTYVQSDISKFDNWKGLQSYSYSALHGGIFVADYMWVSDLGTDLWVSPYNRTWGQELMYYEGLSTNQSYIRPVFRSAYSMINNCNNVIKTSKELVDGDAANIEVLVAEARFMRAFYYSILVTYYGNITLVTETNNSFDVAPKRNTYEEIYSFIINDLKYAAEKLKTTPYENNSQRATQKAALGLLARVYAQGAGEGLSENGKSYWVRAKEVAEDLITNKAKYGADLYTDFADVFASANNKASVNKEALFCAVAPDPTNQAAFAAAVNGSNFKVVQFLPEAYAALGANGDFFKTALNGSSSSLFYGRMNEGVIAPSHYLINCFNANYDKRWENSFITAFGNYTSVRAGSALAGPYSGRTATLTGKMCYNFGIDSTLHKGKKIYPYVDVTRIATAGGQNQFPAKIWPKGDHTGDTTKLISPKNVNVHPYPLAVDEDRFAIYLSKDRLSDEDKKARAYICINIDDLFDSEDKYVTSYSVNGNSTNLYQMFPALSKYLANFYGSFVSSNLQRRNGDIMILRMAEIYLIAAEATLMSGGSSADAAKYLNILRQRACRNTADFNTSTGMQLTTATINDVYDEYAREMCGEFYRWGLLKRHNAFEERLQKYNIRAFRAFDAAKHKLRPISKDFLDQITNANEYGSNGY